MKRLLVSACVYVAGFVLFGLPTGSLATSAASQALAPDQERLPLSLEAAFESTRLIGGGEGASDIYVSPDGQTYAALLVRGDLRRRGVELEVIHGGLNSLESAWPRSVARLFTRALGPTVHGRHSSADLLLPVMNPVRWLDRHRVAFLWNDEDEVRQVVAVDLENGRVSYLTSHSTDVVTFGVSPEGRVLYRADPPYSTERSDRFLRDGYSVNSPQAISLLVGLADGTDRGPLREGFAWYIAGQNSDPIRVDIQDAGYNWSWPPALPLFSQDGRYALVDGVAASILPEWQGYTSGLMASRVAEWIANPEGLIRNQIQQHYVVDLQSGRARPLWAAPVAIGDTQALTWSPDAGELVLVRAFFPIDGLSEADRGSNGIAVVNTHTGAYAQLPIDAEDVRSVVSASWQESDELILGLSNNRIRRFQRDEATWTVIGEEMVLQKPKIRVNIVQTANQPPRLHAADESSGRSELVFDPNPGFLERFALGRVEIIHWQTPDGDWWRGRLYYPAHYRQTRRYPLVIQTNDSEVDPDLFTLYGMGAKHPGIGPGFPPFIGQLLAGREVAVLSGAAPVMPRDRSPTDTRLDSSLRRWIPAYEAAAEELVRRGLVDRNRVGIMGFSNRGWHVEYALSFTDFPYAAAIASDNIAASYVQAALTGWLYGVGADLVGAQPFGEGLKAWLENSPTLNAEHVHTPLQIQVFNGAGGVAAPVVHGWESFSRLRFLRKPVELYVGPNIVRGAHALQNPDQVLPVQQRTLDWWLYWLKDERDPSEAKRDLYASWDKLRELRDEDAKRPKPPRLRWTVEVVEN